jgi:hypothetical protein
MGRGLLFTVGFVMAITGAAAAPEDPLRDVTSAIGAAEDGKIMRVHGIIDDCLPDGCFICPDWQQASRQDQRFRRPDCYSILGWKDSNAGLLLDELYRFSDVVIVGRFHFNKPNNDEVDVLCLDFRRCEQSGFEDISVERVIERRAVEKVPNAPDPIVPISTADDTALRTLFWDDPDFSLVYLDGPDTEIRTYTRPAGSGHPNLEGWLCYARKSVTVNPDERFPWPTTYRAIELRSPANPYRCRLAWKEKGTWRIVRELQKLPVYGLD